MTKYADMTKEELIAKCEELNERMGIIHSAFELLIKRKDDGEQIRDFFHGIKKTDKTHE